MLKILWLAPFPVAHFLDGVEADHHPATWILNLRDRFIEDGRPLTILSMSRGVNEIMVFRESGATHLFIPARALKKQLLTGYGRERGLIRRAIRDVNPDVVHCHGTEHIYTLEGVLSPHPSLITIQGILGLCARVGGSRPWDKSRAALLYNSVFERRAIARCGHFISHTRWSSDYVRSINPGARLYEHLNVIGRGYFSDDLGISPDGVHILFVGGAHPFKGYREALKAFDRARKVEPGLKLRMVGGGRNEILSFIKRERLAFPLRDLEILDRVSPGELPALYRDCFALLHPSYIDNAPTVVCEAQVAGLPVVASAVGGVPDLVRDGDTGLLARSGDFHAMADAILALKRDGGLWARISETGRVTARKRHDPEKIYRRTLEIYEEVARDAGPGRGKGLLRDTGKGGKS